MSLLSIRGLRKHFPIRRGLMGRQVGALRAVDGVDLDVNAGEALGLVGESGCGKSTLARVVMRLLEADAGSVHLDGIDLLAQRGEALRKLRTRFQMIFQDPYGSLNPRLTVGEMITEPLEVHGIARGNAARDAAVQLLERVGLNSEHLARYPHEFSGGQRQRVAIARALIVSPTLVVCDEPVSALDVSVQAQVLNLLSELQRERGLGYLFISHDLAVVSHLCKRVAVMYLGEIVEEGPVDVILREPLHPYTQGLLAAVPDGIPRAPGQARVRRRGVPKGDLPSPTEPSTPARILKRFPEWTAAFSGTLELREVAPGHRVRCADLAALRQLGESLNPRAAALRL